MYFLLFVGVLCFDFVLVCITLRYFLFCNHLDGVERASCFAFIYFPMSCFCQCFAALPCGTIGWSAMCDCGVS